MKYHSSKLVRAVLLSTMFAFIAFLIGWPVTVYAADSAPKVKNLRVESLKNPVGIDVATPHFSWELDASERGTVQTAYSIKVSTDATGSNSVWDSGQIDSDRSVHVEYTGSTLSSSTRYYWQVTVWNNHGNQVQSTENAYFETGLLDSGWSGAQWIKATTISQNGVSDGGDSEDTDPGEITDYSVSVDFEIKDVAAGICFGMTDASNFFMWQINLESGNPRFRPHAWTNGNASCLEEKDLTGIIDIQPNTTYTMRIDIVGDEAKTYIDDVLVDTRNNPRGGNFGFGKLGIRADKAEHSATVELSYFDNFKVTTSQDGKEKNLFSEDFSNPDNFAFTAGTVEDGRLMVQGASGSVYSWQKEVTEWADVTDYTISVDFEIVDVAAGICFGQIDDQNFYMWQVNIEKGFPRLRPHSWKGGNGACHDNVDLTDLINIEKNKVYTMRIEVKGTEAKTYIDDILVDTRENPRGGNYGCGKLGIRADRAEESETVDLAYYDNFRMTTEKEGKEEILFAENFSDPANYAFNGGTVEEGRLKVEGAFGTVYVWQKKIEPDLDVISDYSVSVDFEVKDIAAGICFGQTDASNFYMWQINIEKGYPLLRPHSWRGGNGACHDNVNLTDIVDIQAGQVYNMRIDVTGNVAKTYIDGKLIDTRENPRGGNYGYGLVGIRADKAEASSTLEAAYYDNFKVTTVTGGQEVELFSEDFSDAGNFKFTKGTVEDGRLYVLGAFMSVYSWQISDKKSSDKYTIEMDMTLIKDNAGIIFSAKNTQNMYMWAVNTHDDANAPLLRRHIYTGGNPNYSDVNIGSFYSKADLLNTERHLKIEVAEGIVKTYIDDVLVDTFKDTDASLHNGFIGFRAYVGNNTDEIAYFDNVKVTTYTTVEGVETSKVTFSENFEDASTQFEDGEVIDVDGNKKLKMYSRNGDTRILQNSSMGIPMFRKEFNVAREVKSAKIYSSGLGVYDIFINGDRVGHLQSDNSMIFDELKPGWTDYSKEIFYTTYDVTQLLKQGQNAIGAQVSSGWWNGDIAHSEYGSPELGFIAKLLIEYTDGSNETVVTDLTWLSSTDGPVMKGDIYHGESYDARKEKDWSVAGFDASQWYKTAVNTDFRGKISAFVGPAVRVRDELRREPQTITVYEGAKETGTAYGMINVVKTIDGKGTVLLKKGQTVVYDLGQNMVGWVRFTAKGEAGTKMKFRFGEMLNDKGDTKRGDDGPGGSIYTINLRNAKATMYYTLKGDEAGETYNPSTTFFGFRYCEVTATQEVEISALTGEVVGSVTEEGSSFETSHSAVNQLYQNVIWGQRGNFLSIPTDCPQRDERLGWTGDTQIFSRAATYNADVKAFYHKWMGDMRNSQRNDGAYPDVAPHAWVGYGNAAWAEAGLVVPWTVYLMYGDKSILEENYESMEKYMGFLANQKGDGYEYNGAGTNYGDWVAFESTDSRYVSVCYYAYAAQLMEKISLAMSTSPDDEYAVKAEEYKNLYGKIKEEFQKRYTQPSGLLRLTSQTSYLLALKLDLFPTETAKEKGLANLNYIIKQNGNKLKTGFVGTGILNQTLSQLGADGTAYNLLLQRENPSWLYSVDQGATTIWERWDSYTKERGFHSDITMNSFNHYSYGAVSEWMYRYVAGIEADESNPGFKNVILQPTPDNRTSFPDGQERITWAKATYNSYYGDIKSAWMRKDDGRITYTATIPANTTATLYLPVVSENDEIFESGKPVAEAEGVTFVEIKDGKAKYELKSGTYNFDVNPGEEDAVKSETKFFSVYPNPVEQMLNIATDEEIQQIIVVDSTGKAVHVQSDNTPIDSSRWSSGIYLVKVITGEKTRAVKVLKK